MTHHVIPALEMHCRRIHAGRKEAQSVCEAAGEPIGFNELDDVIHRLDLMLRGLARGRQRLSWPQACAFPGAAWRLSDSFILLHKDEPAARIRGGDACGTGIGEGIEKECRVLGSRRG